MAQAQSDAADKCPVDHESRQRWANIAKESQFSKGSDVLTIDNMPPAALRLLHDRGYTKYSLDNGRWEPDLSKAVKVQPGSQASLSQPQRQRTSPLPTDRQISSIPRAQATNHDRSTELNSAERAALPIANREQDTGHDRDSGNWIYPSQEMFFNAMKRKGHSPQANDMSTIVPIHNAVNERAWNEILRWEASTTKAQASRLPGGCEGPKLVSFSGDSTKLTPRARWKEFVGYQKPFDRHDWIVERCGGERVEYVIDFYQGKAAEGGEPRGSFGGGSGGPLSFYLDVRPKLNGIEGWRMRGMKAVGLS